MTILMPWQSGIEEITGCCDVGVVVICAKQAVELDWGEDIGEAA